MENLEEGKIIDGVKNLFGLGSKSKPQPQPQSVPQQTQQVDQQSMLKKEFEDRKSYLKSRPEVSCKNEIINEGGNPEVVICNYLAGRVDGYSTHTGIIKNNNNFKKIRISSFGVLNRNEMSYLDEGLCPKCCGELLGGIFCLKDSAFFGNAEIGEVSSINRRTESPSQSPTESTTSVTNSNQEVPQETQTPNTQNSTEQRLGLPQPQSNQSTALSLSSSERHRVNKAFDKIDFIAEKVPQADGAMAQAYKTIADYINTMADQILNNLGLRYAESAYKKFNKLRESYKDFDWQYIRQYFMRLEDVDFSNYDKDQLYDYLCDYFDKLDIELRQAQEDWSPWKDSYVFDGETTNNGYIVIYVDFENIYEALKGTAYKKECVTSLAITAVHELMHRYQCTQYSDRKWDKIKTAEDYLSHKDEISAHIVGGVAELLSLGYTKEDLKKALTSIDSDLENNRGPFWESNSLFTYWNNFGSFDSKDPVWMKFKKELAERILEIDNEE